VSDRSGAAGEDRRHFTPARSKRRRALRGVEHAQSPAAPGSDIDDPAARFEAERCRLGGLGDGGKDPADGSNREAILAVKAPDQLASRAQIEVAGIGMDPLCRWKRGGLKQSSQSKAD